MLGSLRGLAQTLIEALRTRVELAATEIEEHSARLVRVIVLCAVAGFCLALAVLLVAFFLVVAFWESHRLVILGVLACGFGGVGAVAAWLAWSAMSQRPRPLQASIEALNEDLAALRAAAQDRQP